MNILFEQNAALTRMINLLRNENLEWRRELHELQMDYDTLRDFHKNFIKVNFTFIFHFENQKEIQMINAAVESMTIQQIHFRILQLLLIVMILTRTDYYELARNISCVMICE